MPAVRCWMASGPAIGSFAREQMSASRRNRFFRDRFAQLDRNHLA
jgi:hypothetical protein